MNRLSLSGSKFEQGGLRSMKILNQLIILYLYPLYSYTLQTNIWQLFCIL